MAVRLDVRADFKPALTHLEGFSERRIRAAIATAISRTAREVEKTWRLQFGARLDRPTPYTMRSTRVEFAKADTLTGRVYLKADGSGIPPAEYLSTQESGGDRNLRKFEQALVSKGSLPRGMKVVPGPYAKLDAYGNLSRGQIVQVLNQIGGELSAGYRRVIGRTAAKRSVAARRSGRAYVAIPQPLGKLEAGVYFREGRLLRPVMFYVKSTRYRARLELLESGTQTVRREIIGQVEQAIEEHRKRLAAAVAA